MYLTRFIFFITLFLAIGNLSSAQTKDDARLVDSLVHVADSINRKANSLTTLDSLKVRDSLQRSLRLAADSGRQVNDSFGIVQDTSRKQQASDSVLREAGTPAGGGYEISGIIKDKNTGEGIPFGTVIFLGSGLGTPSDLDGRFTLTFPKPPSDTLRFQAMGYGTYNKRFDKSNHKATYIIELTREAAQLGEFVFHAGEDPALALLKKIIRAKPDNNPDRLDNYKYEVYNKLEVDIQHLTRKQFEKLPVPMLKKFSFIYDNLDTTSEETPFLPIFLTETLSDYYFQHNPKKAREFIKASRVKGVKNESIDPFLGAMYQNVNAYDNFIPVFDKSYVSPISNNRAFYYKYRIKDTQVAYGHQIILVEFAPKRKGENCFFGDFWVADTVWAIQRISMEVPKEANINWVTRVSLYQEFAPVHDTLWFCTKDKFVADFVAPYNVKFPGFIGRKTTSYKNIVVNDNSISNVVNDVKVKEDVTVSDSARNASDEFWNAARHDTLSKNERAIYSMVDTLNNMPVFIRFKHFIKLLVTGMVDFGPFELGPYYNVYSHNPVEGDRIRLGMYTTQKFLKDVRFDAYGAYGTLDTRVKYYGSALWLLDRHPRMYLFASYRHDVDRSNNYYDNQVTSDNIFGTLFRKSGVPYKLAFVNDARFEFFKEYHNGFSHMLTLQHRTFFPYEPLPSAGIFRDVNGNSTDEVINMEAGIRLRFAYKEKFLEGNYYRLSLGSKYPIVELRYGLGVKNVFLSNYDYQKVTLSISDHVKIAPFGSMYYNFFGGKYFNTLPYPLLEVHPGNEFRFYNKQAFNMMNRYEFISDQYAGFNLEHTIGGGIFNYIPFLKKAKLRQFWTAKGIIGSLTDENKALNLVQGGYKFRTLEGNPYIEVGTGIENIFQLFRIDFIWRVTPKPLPDESKEKYFGIFGSVKFNF